jgi:hypothetical protein
LRITDLPPSELKAAREKYQYVPARLIRAPNGREPDLNWKSLKLVMDIPQGWDSGDQDIRSQYSSIELDDFHYSLLQSESESDLIHGLLSVVFWGFASGTNGRINSKRALRRAEQIVVGRKNAQPQSEADIISHIRKCRQLLNASQIAEALREATQIKFLQMSFASKLLTFMAPNLAAVYDKVISERLADTPKLQKNLFVSTKNPSKAAKLKQVNVYANWCRWCVEKADDLNASGITWRDWNGTEHSWRAVDVEKAWFALDR